ncbi:ATP-binding protein [Amycolatopsis sp. H6(2020)]|nr:ATP-binding protein [Amycolatopsis sp. H6(2020)]
MPDGTNGRNGSAPWSMDLRGTTAPALVEVRRWASRTLTQVDDTHLGDVLLVATELVTNAYDHGRGPLGIRMSHTAVPCRVRIEVDDSCLTHPVVATSSPATPGGRGMHIVDKIAAGWGVLEHPETGSKTVWAEVSGDGVDAAPCDAVTRGHRWSSRRSR